LVRLGKLFRRVNSELGGGVAGVEVVEGEVVAEKGRVHAVRAAEVEDACRAVPGLDRLQQFREEATGVLGGSVVEGTQGLEVPSGVRQVVDVVEVGLVLLVVLGVGVRHPSCPLSSTAYRRVFYAAVCGVLSSRLLLNLVQGTGREGRTAWKR
jgi:hypothetical protein